jgi:hypothetical protein
MNHLASAAAWGSVLTVTIAGILATLVVVARALLSE